MLAAYVREHHSLPHLIIAIVTVMETYEARQ